MMKFLRNIFNADENARQRDFYRDQMERWKSSFQRQQSASHKLIAENAAFRQVITMLHRSVDDYPIVPKMQFYEIAPHNEPTRVQIVSVSDSDVIMVRRVAKSSDQTPWPTEPKFLVKKFDHTFVI